MSSPPSQQPLKQVKTTTISSSTHPKSLTHQIPISKQNKRKFKFLQSSIDKLTAIDLSTWFDSSLNWKNVKPPKIYVNLNLPISASNSNKNKKLIKDWYHPNNQIKTAKYSVLSFIPRNLLEQFRRVANVFFLVLVILQFIPKFIQVSPALAALPLLCVLAITAIKDAHEDARRHASDHQTNLQTVLTLSQSVYTNQNLTHPKTSSAFSAHFLFRLLRFNRQKIKSSNSTTKRHWFSFPCNSKLKQTPKLNSTNSNLHSNQQQHRHHDHDDLNNGFQIKTWQDLQVGDFVKLKNNQAVPADIIICSTSDEEENVCFIETKNLDGETNLKSRHALQSLSHLRNSSDFSSSNHHPQDHPNQFTVENQLPDPNMFSYNAVISFPDRHNHSSSPNQSQSIKSQHQVPVDLNSILLRGTVIRNTEWIIGLVIFTGPNTKIMLNSSPTPSKRSKVERQMNPMVFINLAILALMCLFNAIGTHLAEKYYYKRNAYWSVGSDRSDDNPDINGLIGFAYAMITYQNIVPISLYISIEFVRTIQAYFIWADEDLKYKGRRTLARSWNLSDDLGQIQYIFTDKTGTLTQNLMQFKQCSIAGKIYRGHHQPDKISKEEDVMTDDTTMNGNIEPIKESSKLSTLHPNPAHQTSPRKSNQDSLTDSNAEKSKQDSQDSHDVLDSSKLLIEPFKDIELSKDLAMLNTDRSRMIHGFFACLALCHTVLVSEESDGSIHYKAQSPDEAALVQAAADTGFVFRGRDKNIIKLQVPSVFNKLKPPSVARSTQQLEIEPVDDVISEEEHSSEIHEYELLELIEFTSVRKRMSVIVKKIAKDELNSDPQIYLLVKGADNVIFERLAPGQDQMRQKTDDQLEDFANQGLRTLCLAYRPLDEAELKLWSQNYSHACSQLGSEREKIILAVQDEIEHDLILLGATAIEDKLQDGVPETISDLKRAGIKVWMATGDKLETAVAIARSCHLIGNDMNLIIVKGGAYGQSNSAYEQIRKALVNFFDGAELVDQLENLPPNRSQSDPYTLQPSINQSPRQIRNLSLHEDLESILGEDNGNRAGGYGLVIDGGSLNYALEEKFTKEALLELATRCLVVVCCRTSPKQKSEIVKLIKDGIEVQTLAIGDGANDVSMIQTADIGIGVFGEEGLQAVNSSDYSVGQFRLISKLLFLHGHWSYDRNSLMILNFFYKEIIGISVLWFYQFWCAYSTTTLYEYTYLLFYNVFWTLLPVIGMGVFIQDVSQKVLLQVPELYSIGREGKLFGIRQFGIYMIQGIYQGAICFFFITFAYDTVSARDDGLDVGMNEVSTVIIVAVIWVCNLFNGLDHTSWNWWTFGFVAFGPIIILLYTAVYSALKPGWVWTEVYGNNHFLWSAPNWWFGILLAIVLSLMPQYLIKYYQQVYHPTDLQILRYIDLKDPNHDFIADEQMPYKRVQAHYVEEIKEGKPLEKVMSKEEEPIRPELFRSRTSLTHDMATGQLSPSARGFNFDQADGVGERAVGNRLRRYNTTLSAGLQFDEVNENKNNSLKGSLRTPKSIRTRPRSLKIGNLDFAFGAFSNLKNKIQSDSQQPSNQQSGSSNNHTNPNHTSFSKRLSVFLHHPPSPKSNSEPNQDSNVEDNNGEQEEDQEVVNARGESFEVFRNVGGNGPEHRV